MYDHTFLLTTFCPQVFKGLLIGRRMLDNGGDGHPGSLAEALLQQLVLGVLRKDELLVLVGHRKVETCLT